MSEKDWDARYEKARKGEIVRGILDRCIPRLAIEEQRLVLRTRAIAMNVADWRELPLLWVALALLDGGQWPNMYCQKLADAFSCGSGMIAKDAELSAFWDWKYGLSVMRDPHLDM